MCGRRHHNCYATAKAMAGVDEAIRLKIENIENRMSKQDFRDSQGFITSTDRYVDRREGFKIAKDNDQIQFGLDSCDDEDQTLISENLY